MSRNKFKINKIFFVLFSLIAFFTFTGTVFAEYKDQGLFRNQWLTSESSMSDPVLATCKGDEPSTDSLCGTNTDLKARSNYTIQAGPGNSVWTCLRDTQSADCTTSDNYSSVALAAKSMHTTLYTVYTFNVTFTPGANVTSVGSNSATCLVTTADTSCNVVLPTITPMTNYASVGWSTTNGAQTGESAGNDYEISNNPTILYANAVKNKLTGGVVKITGINTYGNTLTANIVTAPTPTPDNYTYQWYSTTVEGATSGGVPISGATAQTYTIGDGLVGKYIYVVVEATKTGYEGVTMTDATDIVENNTAEVSRKNATMTLASTKTLTYPTAGNETYTYDGDGTLSCSSANPTYVTCSVDTTNNKLILTPVKVTSSPINVTLNATQGANYNSVSKTIAVTVLPGTLTGGSVKIIGTNTWGNTLTASVTDTTPVADNYTYQWYYTNTSGATSGGTAITGATSSTYTVDKSLVGKYIYVTVTASKENYTSTSFSDASDVTNNTTSAVAKQDLTVSTTNYSGVLDGNTHYATIKVTSPSWDGSTIVSGETTSYGQSVTSSGAVDTSYNLKPGYSAPTSGPKNIYYKVTGGTYYNDKTGSATVTIQNHPIEGNVSISGTKVWGYTLTSSVSTTDPTSGCTYTYQWYSNTTSSTSGGTPISGATSDTYTIDKSLVGKYIYLVVTASKTGYDTTELSTVTTTPVGKRDLVVSATNYSNTYDGSAHSASIKVTSEEWNGKVIASGTNTSYTNTVTDNGAVNATYVLKPTYTNVTNETTIYYKVYGGDYYNDKTGTATVTITPGTLQGGSVVITGTNTWGSTLTANVTDTNPVADNYTYQWYYTDTPGATSGGTAISGATGSTYIVDKSLVGKYIYVTVTASKANYTSKSFSDSTDNSNGSAAVGKQDLSVTTTNSSSVYDGNAHSATIKVTSPSWNGSTILSGETTSYNQNVTSSGVVDTVYNLKPSYTNQTNGVKTIYYKVSGGSYYNDKTGTATVTVSKAEMTCSVSISGVNTWGQTLTANPNCTVPSSGVTYEYQWYSNTNNSTSGGTPITGATNSTYTVDKSLVGKYVYVVVTAKADNYNNATISDITDSSSNTSATVDKQELTVTTTNYSDVYDGNIHYAKIKVTSPDWNGLRIDSGVNTSYSEGVTTNGVVNTSYNLKPGFSNVTDGIKTIYYKVTGGTYYKDKTGTASVQIITASTDANVTISGTNTWGQTLTATPTTTDPPSGCSFTYKWYYNTNNSTSGGTQINGVTSNTYTIDKSLVDKYIYVVTTVSCPNHDDKDVSSITTDSGNGTARVAKQNLVVSTTNYSGSYDGNTHYATIKVTSSDWNGSAIVSGTTSSYGSDVTTSGVVDTSYNLKPGYSENTNGIKTIYYKVSGGSYYNDKTGTASVSIANTTFTPGISMTIPNEKAFYKSGDTITYNIVVTNNESYPINNVVVEDSKATIISSSGYTVSNGNAIISNIPAGGSVTVIATKTITNSDVNTFNNTAQITSATASNATLSTDTISASKIVNIQYILKISNTVNGNMADSDLYFKYKVTINGASNGTYTISGQSYTGTGVQTVYTVGSDNYVWLKHNEVVTIGAGDSDTRITTGTTYSVMLVNNDDYYTYINGSTENNKSTGTKTFSSSSNTNIESFVNSKNQLVPTGILAKITLSYALIIFIPCLLIFIIVLIKRKVLLNAFSK